MNPNPYSTQNALGTFSVQSDGFMQGMAQNDPVIRYSLAQGILAVGETQPMWGGCAITESIAIATVNDSLGNSIARASAIANITGFSVFDQNFAAVGSPASPVPTVNLGGSVMFYRLGSRAKIAVAIDSVFAATLQGGQINGATLCSWDFGGNRLELYNATSATIVITSITPTFVAASAGVPAYEDCAVVVAAACAPASGVGDMVTISGATNTGTAGNAIVNGTFQITQFTDNQHWRFRIYTPTTNEVQTVGGSPVVVNPGGALAVNVLKVNIGNSKIVNYSNASGSAVWVPNQSCALIEI